MQILNFYPTEQEQKRVYYRKRLGYATKKYAETLNFCGQGADT
jgi:hypothetical protein